VGAYCELVKVYESPLPTRRTACVKVVEIHAQLCEAYFQHIEELSSGDNPTVKIWKIHGSEQPSDIFTKAPPRVSFEKHRKFMAESVWNDDYVTVYSCYILSESKELLLVFNYHVIIEYSLVFSYDLP
jgi:hypothetical protein